MPKQLHQYEVVLSIRLGQTIPGIEARNKTEALKLANKEFKEFAETVYQWVKHDPEGGFIDNTKIRVDEIGRTD